MNNEIADMLKPIEISEARLSRVLAEADRAANHAILGMKDGYPCGGAWCELRSNSPMVKMFKKFGKSNGQKGINQSYEYDTWHVRKSYPTGFMLSGGTFKGYQNMHMDIAAYAAVVEVLARHNMESSVKSFID